jgi:SAM-dependent methyltransferase
MDKEYYKEYYHLERKNWWFTVRSKILADRIATFFPKNTQKQVLNVGVATGATSEMLAQFGQVMSVEYDKDCYEFTKTILKTPLINGSILEMPFENLHYDLVCAFDVIEHVEDDLKAVQEMKRVCKKGGYVMVTVPAFMSLWGQHDVVNQHYRRYRLHELEQLFLADNDGIITYKNYFNSLLFPPIFLARTAMKFLAKFTKPKREGAGSDHTLIDEDSVILKILENIFETERKLLQKAWKFPVGVSAVLVWKKN